MVFPARGLGERHAAARAFGRRCIRDDAGDPGTTQRPCLGRGVRHGIAARPERHGRQPVGDGDDERERSVAWQLLAQQPPGAGERVGERRPARERHSASRRRSAARARVGGSATVASGTPPLNATSATLSPRRVASSSSAKRDPLDLLDHAARRAPTSCCRRRSRRRTASGARGPCGGGPPGAPRRRPAAAHGGRAQRGVDRDVVSPRPREPVARVLARAPADERARAPPDRAALEPVAPAAAVEDARRVASTLSTAGARSSGRRLGSSARSPPPRFFSGHLRPRARPRGRARARAASSSGAGPNGSSGSRWPSASSAASSTSSGSTRLAPGERRDRLRALDDRDVGAVAATPTPTTRPAIAAVQRSGTRTAARSCGARAIALGELVLLATSRAGTPSGSAANASRRRITSARAADRAAPRPRPRARCRSAICGRSSPSSGFIVPTRRNRAGWETDTPSRSTTLTPSAAASSSTSAEVVVEQVDLVDVEDPAVRLGQQPGLERLVAVAQRPRDVDRAGDAILGRVQRQVDDRARRRGARQLLAACRPLAHDAHGSSGSARERAVGDDVDLRQQLGERRARRSTSRCRSAP